jgi:hypothetical protein
MSWDEAATYERGRRTGLYQTQPGAMAGGEVIGLAGSAGVGAPALTGLKGLSVAGKAAAVGKNAARLAGAGGAAGAVTAAANNSDIVEGYGLGAGLGVAGGAVATGVTSLAPKIAETLAGIKGNAGLRALANQVRKKTGETWDAATARLEQAFAHTSAVTGKPARIVEIVDDDAQVRIGDFVRRNEEAAALGRKVEQQAGVDLQRDLEGQLLQPPAAGTPPRRVKPAPTRQEIKRGVDEMQYSAVREAELAQEGRKMSAKDEANLARYAAEPVTPPPAPAGQVQRPPGVARLEADRKAAADATMAKIRDQKITLPVTLLPKTRRAIATAVGDSADPAAVADLENGVVSIQTLENVRDTMRARNFSKPGYSFDKIADEAQKIASDRSPAYAKMLSDYEKASSQIEGVQHGLTARSAESVDYTGTLATKRPGTREEFTSGAALGAKEGLVGEAGRSPAAAVDLAAKLTRNKNLKENLAASIGDDETARVIEIGRAQLRAAEGRARAAPRAETAPTESSGETAVAAAKALAVSTLHSNLYKWPQLAGMLLSRRWAPPGTAKKLAEYALSNDEAEIRKFFAYMRGRGVADELSLGLISKVTAASGAQGSRR